MAILIALISATIECSVEQCTRVVIDGAAAVMKKQHDKTVAVSVEMYTREGGESKRDMEQ